MVPGEAYTGKDWVCPQCEVEQNILVRNFHRDLRCQHCGGFQDRMLDRGLHIKLVCQYPVGQKFHNDPAIWV